MIKCRVVAVGNSICAVKHAVIVPVNNCVLGTRAGGEKSLGAAVVPDKSGYAGADVRNPPRRNAVCGIINSWGVRRVSTRRNCVADVAAVFLHNQPAAVAVAPVVRRLSVPHIVPARLLPILLANPRSISVAAKSALRRRISSGKRQPSGNGQSGQNAENGSLPQPQPSQRPGLLYIIWGGVERSIAITIPLQAFQDADKLTSGNDSPYRPNKQDARLLSNRHF